MNLWVVELFCGACRNVLSHDCITSMSSLDYDTLASRPLATATVALTLNESDSVLITSVTGNAMIVPVALA